MNTAKITILSYEGPVEGLESVLRSLGDVFSPLPPDSVLVPGELLSTEPATGEAERAAPAKPSAQPDAPRARKKRAPGVSRTDLSRETEPATELEGRAKGRQAGSMAQKIRSAFRLDNNYPLTALAKDCYGSSDGESMRKLKQLVGNLVNQGQLKRISAGAYSVVSE